MEVWHFVTTLTVWSEHFYRIRHKVAEIHPANIVQNMQVRNKATSGLKLMHELQLSKTLCSHEHKRIKTGV
jgi:hypothetical protein